MNDPIKVLKIVERLLLPFPRANGAAWANDVLRCYIESVEEFTIWDIESGAESLKKGNFPGYDGRFEPTPPQFATAARRSMEERLRMAERIKRLRPSLPPAEIVHTQEQRSKAKREVADAIASMAASDPQSDINSASNRERWQRVNARFDPPMDDHAVMHRLAPGYSVGAPESDSEAS